MIKRGVISVYLSLTFMIIVSVLLAFLESARCYMLQTMGERYADIAAEMVFSSYVKPLADRYDILVFDGGGEHRESQLFEQYLKMNLESNTDNERLFNLHARVDSGSALRTTSIRDNGWKSLIEQVERYEKYLLGEKSIDKVKNLVLQLDDHQIVNDIKDYSNELVKNEQEVNKEKEEAGDEVNPGVEQPEESIDDPRSGIGKWLSGGLLNLIMPDRSISNNVINVGNCSWQTGGSPGEEIFNRFEESEDIAAAVEKKDWFESFGEVLNHGSNLSINAYILEKFQHLNSIQSESGQAASVLKYEVEYMLYGQNSDRANLEKSINSIFLFRTMLNLIYLYTSPQKQAVTERTIELMNILSQISVIGKVIKLLLMACWAAAEAVVDCAALADSKKVPLIKDDESWNLSMEQLINISKVGGKASSYVKDGSRGMSYEDYLMLLLIVAGQESKIIRMTQLMECNIRLEEGYEEFSFLNSIIGAEFSGSIEIESRFWHLPQNIQHSFHVRYSY